jgi:hypothetical protein
MDTSGAENPKECAPTLGVAWVLQRAAALSVLYFSGCVLAEFAYCLAAEHTLARAVRAGALEATLPRATHRSVVAAVDRRLLNYRGVKHHAQLIVRQNGAPVRAKLQPKPGDRLTVSISTPARVVIPRWLQSLKFWDRGDVIKVSAHRQVPGRVLPWGREA